MMMNKNVISSMMNFFMHSLDILLHISILSTTHRFILYKTPDAYYRLPWHNSHTVLSKPQHHFCVLLLQYVCSVTHTTSYNVVKNYVVWRFFVYGKYNSYIYIPEIYKILLYIYILLHSWTINFLLLWNNSKTLDNDTSTKQKL